MRGTTDPSAVRPSTSTPGPPMTTSVCTRGGVEARGRAARRATSRDRRATQNGKPCPTRRGSRCSRRTACRGRSRRRPATRESCPRPATPRRGCGRPRRCRARPGPPRCRVEAVASTIAAVLERHHEVLDQHARTGQHQRPGGPDDAVGALPVGAGEDLLGRQVGHVRHPGGGRPGRRPSTRSPAISPTVRSVPSPW